MKKETVLVIMGLNKDKKIVGKVIDCRLIN